MGPTHHSTDEETSFVFFDRALPGPFLILWQALGKHHMTYNEWQSLNEPVYVKHGIVLQTSSFICKCRVSYSLMCLSVFGALVAYSALVA